MYGQVSAGVGSLSTRATSNTTLHADETGASAPQTKVVPQVTDAQREDKYVEEKQMDVKDFKLFKHFLLQSCFLFLF